MWIVALTQGTPLQVVLANAEQPNAGVVCQSVEDSWHPLFGVKIIDGLGTKFSLPTCFELSTDAIEALDEFVSMYDL
jgi:hypothetical protein